MFSNITRSKIEVHKCRKAGPAFLVRNSENSKETKQAKEFPEDIKRTKLTNRAEWKIVAIQWRKTRDLMMLHDPKFKKRFSVVTKAPLWTTQLPADSAFELKWPEWWSWQYYLVTSSKMTGSKPPLSHTSSRCRTQSLIPLFPFTKL